MDDGGTSPLPPQSRLSLTPGVSGSLWPLSEGEIRLCFIVGQASPAIIGLLFSPSPSERH